MTRLIRYYRAGCLLAAAFALIGCVSPRYRAAPEKTPAPRLLNVAFAPAPVTAVLNTVITYNGPGSWKRDACWDEYVISLHNPGAQPLQISSATLSDFAGTPRPDGREPWALEKESKRLERKYRDAGITFVRYTAPGVLIFGAGASFASAAFFSAGAATAASACFLALPIYYAGVLTINHHNKAAMEKEFNRRRLALPLNLAPGETRTGSFFFPMVPNPRSLGLRWSQERTEGETALPLGILQGLHADAPAATPTPR
ncbi:MAG: hypothetical protein JWQ62_797 [Lacunisphaera sp.]|nr:hypothetical protein [Lacunisphaera sp.]